MIKHWTCHTSLALLNVLRNEGVRPSVNLRGSTWASVTPAWTPRDFKFLGPRQRVLLVEENGAESRARSCQTSARRLCCADRKSRGMSQPFEERPSEYKHSSQVIRPHRRSKLWRSSAASDAPYSRAEAASLVGAPTAEESLQEEGSGCMSADSDSDTGAKDKSQVHMRMHMHMQ